MKKNFAYLYIVLCVLSVSQDGLAYSNGSVRIKDLCRLSEARDNSLVGYGLVTGLAGTGDTMRSAATQQSVRNVLKNFGINVAEGKMRGRNVASVMIVATLPPFARPGDRVDVNITSMGDARSLVGGTLLRADLKGADGKIYALAQGPVSVGGFSYDLNGNLIQKNHPTAGIIPGGAIVEKSVVTELLDNMGKLDYVLIDPDFTTAVRVMQAINKEVPGAVATAIDANRVSVEIQKRDRSSLVQLISQVENTSVFPDQSAKVVINERTGTVVAGGDVQISNVSITHGDLKVTINTKYEVSQPVLVSKTGENVRTQVVPATTIKVDEENSVLVEMPGNSTISDLVAALNKVRASSRDIITILQAIKRAGGLHSELIIQ